MTGFASQFDVSAPENSTKTMRIVEAEYLHHKAPSVKILVISMINSPLIVKKVMELGVDGYLFKTSKGEVMLTALRQIVQDKQFFEETIKQDSKSRFTSTFNIDGGIIELTRRELEIIKLLSHGKSTDEIADELYISPHTVHTHRKNIFAKLDMHNTAELTSFAIRHSLVASI